MDLLLDGSRGAEAVAVRREIYERRAIHQDYLKLRRAARRKTSFVTKLDKTLSSR